MTARPAPEHTRAAPLALVAPLAWAALGALLVLLLAQLPAAHRVDVGLRDAAYTQGFFDAETTGTYLEGSDGTARWSRPSAALLFPQAGMPGSLTLRVRGWREAGPPPELTLLLNGTAELARARLTGEWQELRVPLAGGWLKATDFFVELRSAPATLPDGREVGVLVDSATYSVGPGPTLPYPAQLLYGALAGLLLALLFGPVYPQITQSAIGDARTSGPRQMGQKSVKSVDDSARRLILAGLLIFGLAWLLLYRLQPPLVGYPLRALPPLMVAGLAGATLMRHGPRLAARLPWLVSVAAPAGVIAGWLAATLLAAQGHVTLSRPGVENDFRVFATRETIAQIFSADGFYNLGYPLLLWLARPLFEGNAFLAGRLVAALSGTALLGAGYWLARLLLPAGPALVALLALALSGFVAQYGLYVGSDMPFAACVALCVAALVHAGLAAAKGGWRVLALAALAGLFGGMAFLMRHLGLLLFPWGLLVLLALSRQAGRPTHAQPGRVAALLAPFILAFLLTIAPQLVINTLQAGQPLYNQQAKNIWLAVYGGTDWGRWEEAPNSIGLAEVVLADPGRFLANWWRNMLAFTGSGAEDTSEFGRALQLRLLGWPANWLAVGGLLAWLVLLVRQSVQRLDAGDIEDPPLPSGTLALALLALILLYVAAVSTAFTLQRFMLPLVTIYAVAAGWTAWRLADGERRLLGVGLALVVVLWVGYGSGTRYVLANQPADEVAAVVLVASALPPEAMVAARVSGRLPLAKYSAIAHRVVDWPIGSDTEAPITADDLAAARAAGASYLLWDETGGPPPLPDPQAARVAAGARYALYRLE